MCHNSVLAWGQRVIEPAWVKGRRVLEVGACNVNGSLRAHIEAMGPAEYIGVDMQPGEGVDEICYAESLLGHFGPEAFDLVLSTEMLEHARQWRAAVHNMKGVLRPGGLLLLTTRSEGFPLHEYPGDYWRFSCADLSEVFSDFSPHTSAPDPEAPGVFFQGRKTTATAPDLYQIHVYSMADGRRVP